ELKGKYEALVEQNRQLQYQIDTQRFPTKVTQPSDELLPKERTTAYKLILGMAKAGYKYDPQKSRSEVPKEIVDDLLREGIKIDRGTVLSWFQKAERELKE